MKNKKTLLSVLVAVVSLAGCSSKEVITIPAETESKETRVSRTLSNEWGNSGLSGAAYNQPAYIHVLGGDLNENLNNLKSQKESQKLSAIGTDDLAKSNLASAFSGTQEIEESKKSSASNNNGTTTVGYSVYELSRWERYCNESIGMDEADWNFVAKQGPQNVPVEVFPNCKESGYTYTKYLATWIDFCEGYEISQKDKDFVRKTVRPSSLKELCKF